MNFTLTIKGTASAMPISDRNPSAQALNVHGRLFLIDCGEGTQQQMRRAHLSFIKVEALFLSHLHGDHLFGVFGLLSTMAMYGRTAPLHVFAPVSFGPVLKFFLSYFGEGINYEIVHHPLKMKAPEVVYTNRSLAVSAFPLQHKIDCFGFRFDEQLSERSKLKRAPRSYAYCSDTMPFPELAGWVSGVDVLYHESTYPQELAAKAAEHFHSTTVEAAQCALEAGAGKLLLGHYSSRVRDFSIFEREARSVFPASFAAQDGDVIEI